MPENKAHLTGEQTRHTSTTANLTEEQRDARRAREQAKRDRVRDALRRRRT